MKRNSGFTLIELIVVLAILSILLGLVGMSLARVAQGVNKSSTADLIYSRKIGRAHV